MEKLGEMPQEALLIGIGTAAVQQRNPGSMRRSGEARVS